MKKKQDLTTQEVIERLGIKYPSPTFGFITQVRSGTGYYAARTADALAMSLWPSRGLHLYGFEIKVSRTDWLKELKQPEKAEELAGYCHYWYMVFGNEDILKIGEMPPTWGIIVPHGKGLKIVKEAPFNKKALPIDYMLLAGIFRNIAEQCIAKELVQGKMDERYEEGKEWAKYSSSQLEKDLKRSQEQIEAFEKASGVSLDKWSANENKIIGEAVREVLNGRDKEAKKRLGKLLTRARNLVKYMEGENISSYDC